jgi:nucleoside-triphosphatase THEP1
MSSRRITIVTGPIDSGKTSWCAEFAAAHPGCAGLLLLKVYRQGERIGYDAHRLPSAPPFSAGERVPFARSGGQEPSGWVSAERIGIFSISATGLRAGNAWLVQAAQTAEHIIIDEIGPLELAGGGLLPGFRAALSAPVHKSLTIVIRNTSIEAVCRRFGISKYERIEVGSAPG